MSVLKNRATNSLLRSEKKSLYRFLILYVLMVVSGMVLLSLYYYETQRQIMLSNKRAILSQYAYIQTKRLKVLHHFFPDRTEYPRDSRFRSAIYDTEYNKIFSLNRAEEDHFDDEIRIENGYVHFIKELDTYYLGTRYLVIEIENDGEWIYRIWKEIALYGGIAFVIFIIFGLYLSKLFLKPMRDSIILLDRFIKDTTHELNTPLSTILANIEMMDTGIMVEKNRKKLERLNIAAKTVSTLYKDLTYLVLEQERKNTDEPLDIKTIIKDRIEYFEVLTRSKRITFTLSLEESTIVMDRYKFIRVIDNLLSNAIKYNKRNGEIEITLKKDRLSISDTGIGIAKEQIPFIFDRYLRFNGSEGGFGIGLSIVKKILDEYDIRIEVTSEERKGTRMVLLWSA